MTINYAETIKSKFDSFYLILLDSAPREIPKVLPGEKKHKPAKNDSYFRNISLLSKFTNRFLHYRNEMRAVNAKKNLTEENKTTLLSNIFMTALEELLQLIVQANHKESGASRKYIMDFFCSFLNSLGKTILDEQIDPAFWPDFARAFYKSLPNNLASKITETLDWKEPINAANIDFPRCRSFKANFKAQLELIKQFDEEEANSSFNADLNENGFENSPLYPAFLSDAVSTTSATQQDLDLNFDLEQTKRKFFSFMPDYSAQQRAQPLAERSVDLPPIKLEDDRPNKRPCL